MNKFEWASSDHLRSISNLSALANSIHLILHQRMYSCRVLTMGFQPFFRPFQSSSKSLLITFLKITKDYVLSIDPVYYVYFVFRQQHQPNPSSRLPTLDPLAFMFVLSKYKLTVTKIKTVQLILVRDEPY